MKKNTLKRFMASAMTAVMCVSSLGTLAVNAAPADPAAETSVVDNLMSKMTLRQKIAQMMMPDFRKWQTESDSGQKNFQVMNDEVAQIIKDYDFGGVILFAENVAQTDQTLKLTTDLQEAATGGTDGSNIPLLLTIDQEGGIVYRLGSGTALPGNMALGATRSTDAATQSGEVIGRELSALGINVDFAPVADVNGTGRKHGNCCHERYAEVQHRYCCQTFPGSWRYRYRLPHRSSLCRQISGRTQTV